MKTAVIISILVCLLQVLAKKFGLPSSYLERDMFGNLDVQRVALRASKKLDRVPSSARRNFPAIEGHFRQRLDHFNDSYMATWQQRYYYNFKYSNHTGFKYAFLMVGGAGPLPPSDDAGEPHISNEKSNIVVQWAKQYGAALFALEHRFYGESRPTADMSVENLKYLNSRQAIDDIVYFIGQMNERYGNAIWIVFGASYSGSLALWARQQYPYLIAGAVASSAPLEITLDFWGLKEGIEDLFRLYSKVCAKNIGKAFAEMSDLMKSSEGREKLQHLFAPDLPKSADDLTEKDVQHFFHDMSIILNLVAIRDPVFPDGDSFTTGIDIVCNHMVDPLHDPLSSYADARNEIRKKLGYTYNDTYNDVVEIFKDEEFLEFDSGQRQWLWQTCTELGMFETTNGGPGGMFGMGVPLSYFINMCTEVFGPEYNIDFIEKAVREANLLYGGIDDYTGTNAVITIGDIDPWIRLMKTTSSEPSLICLKIRGAAHCGDYSERPPHLGLPLVEDAHEIIVENIGIWLNTSKTYGNWKWRYNVPRARTKYPKSRLVDEYSLRSDKKYPEWSNFKQMHLGRPPSGFVQPKPQMIKGAAKRAERGFITQPINHFDDDDWRIFRQKYYMNKAYAKEGGPVFLVIGGETPLSSAWAEGQDMFHMVLAKKLGATVFALEHRYYGDSIVGGTADFPNPDLKYLSSLQMLNDVALFIRAMNAEMMNASPWITFGGSYGGSLSIWARMLFPQLIDGAVGSSARLEAKLDFHEFMQLVGRSLPTWKDEPMCKDLVAKAFGNMRQESLSSEGRAFLSNMLNLEPKWDFEGKVNDLDIEQVFSTIYGEFQHVAYTKNFVEVICKAMRKTSYPVVSLANFYKDNIRKYKENFNHTDSGRSNFASFLRQAHIYGPDAEAMKLWTWQACTEFGWFPTTDSGNDVFVHPTPLNHFTQICSDVFGEEFTATKIKENVDKTNLMYGGLDNFRCNKVVVTAGLNDPWHVLSRIRRRRPWFVTLFIKDGLHCEDMFVTNNSNVQTAQEVIEDNVKDWIASARSKRRAKRDQASAEEAPGLTFAQKISRDCQGSILSNLINYRCLFSLLRNLVEEFTKPFQSSSNSTVA